MKIELDGEKSPGDGLNLSIVPVSSDSSNSRIDGLAINRFGGDGIDLDTLNGGNTIAGNFIGTDVSGTVDLASGEWDLRELDRATRSAAPRRGQQPHLGQRDNGVDRVCGRRASIVGNVIGLDRTARRPTERVRGI